MCGIFGFSGKFESSSLQYAQQLLSHRGPDDRGIYNNFDSKVSFVHTRLAIQDLSSEGHQPMLSNDEQVAIIFNGEIYNFPELRLTLIQKGYSFRGNSDTEVLLNLYLDKGINFLDRLNGIFAFAIFDNRTKELFLVRDSLGVKPLYFYQDNRGIMFSSEIKAMIPFFKDKLDLDLCSIDRYISFLYCPGNKTAISQINKLGPGQILTIKHGQIIDHKAWYVLPQTLSVKKYLTKKESIKSVENGIREAVKRQLISDVPVGAFLSGGLDSSAIVYFAREQNPDISCFSIEQQGGTDIGDHDDLPYAKRVAKHLGVKLNVIKASSESLIKQLHRMIWHLDEPLADPAALNVLYISQLARDSGIKVLLSGAGGDDLFTGYRRHIAANYQYFWRLLPHRGLKIFENFFGSLNQNRALAYKLSRLFRDASATGDSALTKYFLWADNNLKQKIYSKNMKLAISSELTDQPLLSFLQDIDSKLHQVDRMLTLEQRFFLTDHNLTYTDKMSMAVGVEVRVPFLDPRLVEIASRIPHQYKQRGVCSKWVFKKAMEPFLPKDIIYRPKTGFGAPIRRWVKYDLREFIFETLTKESLLKRDIFDHSSVLNLIRDNDEGIIDASYLIFSILCIEIWCKLFIDRDKINTISC